MAMELASEVIREIISDRSTLGSPNINDVEHRTRCLDAAVKEAEIFLANGLSIAVHVHLGHDQCKYKQPFNCKACHEVEVWTVQVSELLGNENSNKPFLIPGFMKQAIHSQLHFSSTKSWFSASARDDVNVARHYTCVYRISTSSYFQNEENESSQGRRIDQHKFPPCKLGNKLISVDVRTLKKEHFPSKPTKCPSQKNDAELWVFPDAGLATEHEKKVSGRRNSKEINLSGEDRKFGREKRANIIVEIPEQLFERKPGIGNNYKSNSFVLFDKANVPHSINSCCLDRRRIDDRPLIVSPTIPQRERGKAARNKLSYRDLERALSPYAQNRLKNRTPRRLLCNFEESVLKGCLRPTRVVDGFKLQLAITASSLATKHITIPTTTSYFSEELSSSLYMSNCIIPNAISNSKHRPGIQIPRQCIFQAVLFNTQGSVVKIFLINVDVSDMPPLSQTFIRQRTQATQRPPTSSTGLNGKLSAKLPESNHNTKNTGMTSLQSSTSTIRDNRTGNAAAAVNHIGTALKFLIHVRLLSDHRGRIWLHGDITMLLSHRGGDLEGFISTQTESATLMPQCPKYSPIK